MKKWLSDDAGATSVEYAIMLGAIAVVIVGAVTALGLATRGLFLPALAGFSGV